MIVVKRRPKNYKYAWSYTDCFRIEDYLNEVKECTKSQANISNRIKFLIFNGMIRETL